MYIVFTYENLLACSFPLFVVHLLEKHEAHFPDEFSSTPMDQFGLFVKAFTDIGILELLAKPNRYNIILILRVLTQKDLVLGSKYFASQKDAHKLIKKPNEHIIDKCTANDSPENRLCLCCYSSISQIRRRCPA